jgi:DNA-binding GntR family transcriptional regulator
MGVSRGPVREAFRMLEEAGLVRTEKNRGVFVRDIPIDEAVEIFDLRAAMDELVGRRLAENITPAAAQGTQAAWSIRWKKPSRPRTPTTTTC